MIVKTSAVCLVFLTYMIGFYYRKPHIMIRSTKIFQMVLVAAFLNSVFDLVTIYTVNNRDSVPETINLVAHIIFLLSILSLIYLMFLYLRSFLDANLRFKRKTRIIQAIPFAASAIGILVLPITYIHGKMTDYSLGPKAYALYVSIVVYMILILYYSLRYWDIIDEEKRMAIVLSVPIYTITSIIQMLMPETLVEIVGVLLTMLGLIMSNENTEKYIDEKTKLFNKYSFELVLEELCYKKQNVNMAVLCIYRIENKFDWKQEALVMRDIHRELKVSYLQGYRVSENGVVFLCGSKEKAETVLSQIKRSIADRYGKESIGIETKVFSEEYFTTKGEYIQKAADFCEETGSRFAYIDYLTDIYNRNALERDLAKINTDSEGYYLIADLNDLKIINDSLGHSAGDELLRGFASLLVESVGEDGLAYRQGGDEFAVLYNGDVMRFIRNLQENCELHNRTNSIKISYAIGYSRYDVPDFIDVADRMMYDDKKRIKEIRGTRR